MKKNMKWAALALSLLVGNGGQFLSAQSLELVSDKGACLDYNPHAYYDIDRDGKLEIIRPAIMWNGTLTTRTDRLSVVTVNLETSSNQL